MFDYTQFNNQIANRPHRSKKNLLGTVALSVWLVMTAGNPLAAPVGGTVAAGQASISQSHYHTTIQQNSDRAVIDWQGFDLAANESVSFILPSAESATVNRITSGAVTTINGTITSNGKVYFVNPNGLVFDAQSRITANGFFASTGSFSSPVFMNGFEGFDHRGIGTVELSGEIIAPTISVRADRIVVAGTLSAPSGKIEIDSTTQSQIGQTGIISVSAGQTGHGGTVKIWSDDDTDFGGKVLAEGGTNFGDGGKVEISGNNSLHFMGTVSTAAPKGKTGQLLLDPTTISIVASRPPSSVVITPVSDSFRGLGTNPASYILVSSLVAALSNNNVTVDATASGSAAGTGKIIVASNLVWSGSGKLTLNAGAGGIAINAAITSTAATRSGLTLTSQGPIIANDQGILTVGELTVSSQLGAIALLANNQIETLGNLSAPVGGSIMVRNGQALVVKSYARFDAGTGGVAILTPGYDLTLRDEIYVKAGYLRLDLGGNRVIGGGTVLAQDSSLYFTAADGGHAVQFNLGRGNFITVLDQRGQGQTAQLDNSWVTPSNGLDLKNSGIDLVTSGDRNGLGLAIDGAVTIDNLTAGDALGLRYIEAGGILVAAATAAAPAAINQFTGSLILVANGTGVTDSSLTAGIMVKASLAANDLRLVQAGTILSSSSSGIYFDQAMVTANGDLTAIQGGMVNDDGIVVRGSTLQSHGDLTLLQSGIVNSGKVDSNSTTIGGIRLVGVSGTGNGVTLAAGSSGLVTVQTTNSKLITTGEDSFTVTGERLRINLGLARLVSVSDGVSPLPGTGYSLNALGLAVYFTADTSGLAGGINVGSGSFTVIRDLGINQTPLTMDSTTTTASLGFTELVGGTVGNRSLNRLRIEGTNDLALTGVGLIYGGALTIDGGDLRQLISTMTYIEAGGILLTSTDVAKPTIQFKAKLTLVSRGTGIMVKGRSYGVYIEGSLVVGSTDDHASHLTISNYGHTGADGIAIGAVTVTAGGNFTLGHFGDSTGDGIVLNGTVIRASDHLRLYHRGSAGSTAINLSNARLNAGLDMTIVQTGKSSDYGIWLKSAQLESNRSLSLIHAGTSPNGLRLSGTLEAGADLTIENNGTLASAITVTDRLQLIGGGPDQTIGIKTKNSDLILADLDSLTVSQGRLAIELGTGKITSTASSPNRLPTAGYRIDALDLDIFYSGATTQNLSQINVGKGRFLYLRDLRADSTNRTLTDSNSLSDFGLDGIVYGGTANHRSLGSMVILGSDDSTLSGLAVAFGGAVELNGIGSSSLSHLNHIEARSITVTTKASHFVGALTLVATGGNGIIIDGVTLAAAGDLSLYQQGRSDQQAIVVNSGSSLMAGRNLSLTQAGIATNNGIEIRGASLRAVGDLSLVQTATASSGGDGLYLYADSTAAGEGVSLVTGGFGQRLTITTHGQNLSLNHADHFLLSSGEVHINLGTGILNGGIYSLNSAGAQMFFSAANSGNSGTIGLGGGSFAFLNDQSNWLAAITLDNSTRLTDLGGAIVYGGSANQRTVAGMTIVGSQDSALQGKGVIFGGVVTIHSVSNGEVAGLRYIKARAIVVSSTNHFQDGLTLVQSGQTRGVGVYISGSLSAGGHLKILQRGTSSGEGILIDRAFITGSEVTLSQTGTSDATAIKLIDSQVSAAARLSVEQSGWAGGDGIAIYSSSLRSGGDLNLLQKGVIGQRGIRLVATGPNAAEAMVLEAGSNSHWVFIKTNNANLQLEAYDNFKVTRGRIAMALGTGRITSVEANEPAVEGVDYTLSAQNLDLYLQAAETGHSVRFDLGSGNLYRSVIYMGAHEFAASDLPSQVGLPNGITVTGTVSAAGALVSTVGLSLSGVTSTNAYPVILMAPEIKVTGTNSFSGGVTLQGERVTLEGMTDFGEAGLTIISRNQGLVLTKNVTLSGGKLTIDLGTATYDNGQMGYSLDTNGGDLILTAGAIANHSAAVIFRLGTGRLTSLGGVKYSKPSLTSTAFNSDYGDSITHEDELGKSKYFLTSLTGDDLTTAKNRVGDPINSLWLPLNALTASRVGQRVTTETSQYGLSKDSGDIAWDEGGVETQTFINLGLKSGKEIHFYGVVSDQAITAQTLPNWVKESTGIVFDGSNLFNRGLGLATTGPIGQNGGLTVSGGSLNLSAGGAILLDHQDNSLGTIGSIKASGTVTLVNRGDLSLLGGEAGRIIATDTIKISTTAKGELQLLAAMESSGGDLVLNLDGVYNGNGHGWDLNHQRLNIKASDWRNSGPIDFAAFTNVSSGGLTLEGGLVPPIAPTLSPLRIGAGKIAYFTSLTPGTLDFSEAESALQGIDERGELHSLADLPIAAPHVPKMVQSGTTVYWNVTANLYGTSFIKLPKEFGFFQLKSSGQIFTHPEQLAEGTSIIFAGSNRLRQALDFTKIPAVNHLCFLAESEVRGELKLSTRLMALGGIVVGNQVFLPSLTTSGTGVLNLSLQGDLNGANLLLTNPLNLVAVGGRSSTVYLTNSGNRIPYLSGNTQGGAVSIVTSVPNLVLQSLDTGGGSVSVRNSNGGVTASDIVIGGFYFNAAGEVRVRGNLASASGWASLIAITSSNAALVVGNMSSDRSLTIDGSTALIAGSLVSGGELEIKSPVMIVGAVEIVSRQSIILGAITAIHQTSPASLSLNAGGGQITLLSPVTPQNPMRWFDIMPAQSNSSTYFSINSKEFDSYLNRRQSPPSLW